MWKTSPARGTKERKRVKIRSLTFPTVDVPTPLLWKSLSIFIVFTTPRQKVKKETIHLIAETGTKRIDLLETIKFSNDS